MWFFLKFFFWLCLMSWVSWFYLFSQEALLVFFSKFSGLCTCCGFSIVFLGNFLVVCGKKVESCLSREKIDNLFPPPSFHQSRKVWDDFFPMQLLEKSSMCKYCCMSFRTLLCSWTSEKKKRTRAFLSQEARSTGHYFCVGTMLVCLYTNQLVIIFV